ncbi:MAG: aldehyde dehydrogenase family protein, partial [Alphaproteobacteria bacterium]
DFARAVSKGVAGCMLNSGQSCNAPTRMLVPAARMEEATEIARGAAERAAPGDPAQEDTAMGPVVSKVQFDKIQTLIAAGIAEGATLVTGGPGLPDGMNKGYFVRPTVFANVNNGMTIAREEVFGPVLTILGYENEDDAVAIANDTPYGLSGYVSSSNLVHAGRIAARLRTGNVHINNAPGDQGAPFGGYKQSGNGREWGLFGFEDFLEVKAVLGAVAVE